jgi:hypothetical protein
VGVLKVPSGHHVEVRVKSAVLDGCRDPVTKNLRQGLNAKAWANQTMSKEPIKFSPVCTGFDRKTFIETRIRQLHESLEDETYACQKDCWCF